MAYLGFEPSQVAVTVGQGVIDASHIEDASITTADLSNDAVTPNKLDDDGTGFQMGSLGLGTAVSGSHKLTVGGTATFSGAITGNLTGDVTGNVTGNTSGTAATVTGAAQSQITSVGTLSSLTLGGDLTLPQKIVHSGDTDTYLSFGTDSLSLYTGGTNVVDFIYGNIYIKGNNKALVGYTTGGGAKELIKINASDNLQIGEAGGGDVKITERLTVGSWDNSNTHGHAYIDISSDANEGADSCLYFNAGTAIKGSIYYNHNATASSQQMYFVTGDNSTNSLILDNSSATFAGAVTLQDQLTVKAEGASNDIVAQWQATNGNNCATFRTTDSGHVFKIMSQNSGTLEFDTSSATFSGDVTVDGDRYMLTESGTNKGFFGKDDWATSGGSANDVNVGSYSGVVKLTAGAGTSSTSNIICNTDKSITVASSILAGYGASHRLTGNWRVIDVVSEDSNDVSTMSSNNCFNDQTYSHFKIIIPWIGVETDGADILCSFLYNTGSGLNEATNQYYGHKQTAAHTSSGYSGGAYSNATRMTIFNNTWNDDSGGINGEVLVYNVTTADMRNFSGTTYTSHDHTGDGDRGSNFRPFATFNVIGYDTTNGYGAQHGSFRQNDDRHASYWKGIRFSTSTGNFATGSKFIVLGMQL